jgi:hypothetical protein
MAYYTDYTLEIIPENKELYQQFLDEGAFIDDDSCKWYSCHEDCIRLSKEYREHLIIIFGKGSQVDDIWKKIYFNGELVWKWHLDTTVPPIPDKILDLVK